MANATIEKEGLRINCLGNADGSYSIFTHDIGGGAGVADSSIEIQGFRILAHDNGDGTYSIGTTTTTGASDQTIEVEGIRLKIHPIGSSQTIGGISDTIYAIVINPN